MELLAALLVTIILLAGSVGFFFWVLYVWSMMITRAPFIAIPDPVVPEIIKALDLKPNSVFYDLGCGEGRVLIAARKAVPSIHAIGYDKQLLPVWIARRRARKAGAAVEIRRGNFFKKDLASATHIFCYLFPAVMADLEPKFAKELRPGTRVVSADFPLPHKEPSRTIALKRPPGALGQKLFVYDF